MTSALRVVKLGANIGARIEGIDLSADVDTVSASKINAALLEHKVIFFRDQHRLDDDSQLALAAQAGHADHRASDGDLPWHEVTSDRFPV